MIKINFVPQLYSGTIEFQNISQETLDALCEVVKKLDREQEQETALPSIKSVKLAKVDEDMSKSQKKPDKPSKPLEKEKKQRGTLSKISAEEVQKIVKEIIETALKNPDQYEFRYVLARDFIAEYPDKMEGVGSIYVGKAMENLGYFRKAMAVNGSTRRLRQFPMPKKQVEKEDNSPRKKEAGKTVAEAAPKPKRTMWKVEAEQDQDSSAKNWNMKQAKYLHDRRVEVGLTISELANVIQYPFYAIQKWENGEAAPSTAAMDVLQKNFGGEFRQQIESLAS